MYDPRKIISTITDEGSWFEIGALWGRTAIVGLARLGGQPVGILANNAEVASGALDAHGSMKLTKHIKMYAGTWLQSVIHMLTLCIARCDVFNLPILQVVDVPGYAVGTGMFGIRHVNGTIY